MNDIELPPLPDADVTNSTNLLGYRYSYSAIAMQAYASAAVEADRAQRVPDGWVQVTQHLLNSQEPWLYKPCWLAFPSGAVLRGVYEWRQGRNPDRFISDEVGDVWAFDVSHVMPVSTPPHPSKALLASTPAPAQQEPNWWRKRADEIELAVARSGSTDAMRCYTDMRTLLQAAAKHQEPPQQERKPMTDCEIEDLCGEANRGVCIELEDYKKAVQDTERHHGIRE